VPGFEEFFRDAYRPLVRDVIFAGWNPDEAEDAVSAAMIEVLQRWDSAASSSVRNSTGMSGKVRPTSR
jgi:hypothetical protein